MSLKIPVFRTYTLAAVLFLPVCGFGFQQERPADALAKRDSLSRIYFERQQALFDMTLQQLFAEDSGLVLRFDVEPDSLPPALNMADSLQQLSESLRRYVAEGLQASNPDISPILDFGRLFRSIAELFGGGGGEKVPNVAELPLPTPLELDILDALWNSSATSGPQLFAKLDSTRRVRLTAEAFWRALRNMARRGYVSEEMISPQLPLTVAIGPVAFPIEMSGKNRRNRVYAYSPLVQEEQLLAFLGARQYLASETGNGPESESEVNTLLDQLLANRRRSSASP